MNPNSLTTGFWQFTRPRAFFCHADVWALYPTMRSLLSFRKRAARRNLLIAGFVRSVSGLSKRWAVSLPAISLSLTRADSAGYQQIPPRFALSECQKKTLRDAKRES